MEIQFLLQLLFITLKQKCSSLGHVSWWTLQPQCERRVKLTLSFWITASCRLCCSSISFCCSGSDVGVSCGCVAWLGAAESWSPRIYNQTGKKLDEGETTNLRNDSKLLKWLFSIHLSDFFHFILCLEVPGLQLENHLIICPNTDQHCYLSALVAAPWSNL